MCPGYLNGFGSEAGSLEYSMRSRFPAYRGQSFDGTRDRLSPSPRSFDQRPPMGMGFQKPTPFGRMKPHGTELLPICARPLVRPRILTGKALLGTAEADLGGSACDMAQIMCPLLAVSTVVKKANIGSTCLSED